MENKEILPVWENPEIQEINRLPMSSPLLPFTSSRNAIADVIAGPEYRGQQTPDIDALGPVNNEFCMSLDSPPYAPAASNPWKFKLISGPYEDLPAAGESLVVGGRRENPDQKSGQGLSAWINPGYDVSSWHNITVPGTWTRQGGDSHFNNTFDKPHYTNVQMPFKVSPPHAPQENPTGLYRRNFTLPQTWKGKRIVLHVGSAESVSMIYVNGLFAGMGKISRLPSEYDITPFVKEGENLLCIKVIRYSDASYVEDQDQWWLGGIHRTVYLYCTQDCYIKDIMAVPGHITGCENKTGKIDLSVTLGGNLPDFRISGNSGTVINENEKPFLIKYNLYPFSLPSSLDDAKKKAEDLVNGGSLLSGSIELFADYRLNNNTACAEFVLENPKAWTHETPNLYILCVELLRDNKLLQTAAFCTGFRNLKIANRELLINDKMVYIKGANRHEHDEKTGKTISTQKMVRDIKILKTHNFNAIRTSHYPDDERWYELCDRYGIYLWDEADAESHGYQNQLSHETRWAYAFVLRMQRMVERDKNHPAIIVWSLGNESGWGASHNSGAAWIRFYDSSRPVHYEGTMRSKSNPLDNWEQGKGVTDIICPMYPVIENIVDYVRYRSDFRPLIMCEYSHAMGNSNGSLADYWKAIETHHGLQGGFIWEWRDHGFEAYTKEGVKYWKYGGDFGDLPTDYDFVCDGLIFPDQGLKPGMAECKQVHAPVRLTGIPGKPFGFIAENRYDFSSLDHLLLRFKFFEAKTNSLGTNTILEGTMEFPALRPGEKAEIDFAKDKRIDLPSFEGAVIFRAEFVLKEDTPWAQKGHVVANAHRLLKEERVHSQIIAGTKLNEDDLQKFSALFKPSLYRVPTQNDGLKTDLYCKGESAERLTHKGKALGAWVGLDLLHMQTVNEKKEKTFLDGQPAVRTSATLLAGVKASGQYQRYMAAPGLGTYSLTVTGPTLGAPGVPMVMEIIFDLDQELPDLPKVGIMAEIPAFYNEISWLGLGPEESYPDRLAGVFLGRHKLGIAEFETPYVVPQENGNRSGVRAFTLLSSNPAEANITVRGETPFNIGVSRYSQENMWKAFHTWELADLTQKSDGKYFLSIDIAQRGIGTATCGPDTREEYKVRPGLFRMKLFIF